MKIDKWVEERDAVNAHTVGKAAEWCLTPLGTRRATWEKGPSKCLKHRLSFSWVCVPCVPELTTYKTKLHRKQD